MIRAPALGVMSRKVGWPSMTVRPGAPRFSMMDSSGRSGDTTPKRGASLISAALLPLGALALFSFGAQVVFAPLVLVIEWILARVAVGSVKIAWSLLAGVLAGEFVYLQIDLHTDFNGFLAVVAGLAAALVVTFVYLATTGRRRSDDEVPAV